MITFMFAGQGSQKRGMGGELFGEFPELVARAADILRYSVVELCLDDPRDELNRTQFTQPALYVVNALAYAHWIARGGIADALVGHSLGEFNALQAAGVYDFETGLRLVQTRGQLMSKAEDGAMAAIVNASADEIRRILWDGGLDQVDLANFNAPNQVVISGRRADIHKAQPLFEERLKAFTLLNTSGAFHSRWMLPAKERFDAALATVEFRAPTTLVIANCSARPYDAANTVANLSQQIASPVRWVESIEYLIDLGEMTFEEVAHSKVLTKLVKKIVSARAELAPQARSVAPPST